MQKPIHSIAVLGSFLLFGCGQGIDHTVIYSPDQEVSFELSVVEGQLVYSALFRDSHLIETSEIAFSLDSVLVTDNIEITGIEKYSGEEQYERMGSHILAKDSYRGAKVFLKSHTGIAYHLDVRVFDNAAAFRLVFPDVESGRVPDEAITFKLPEGSTVWYHGLRMHYEGVHDKNLISDIPIGEWLAPPVTFRLPGNNGYGTLMEADLKEYSGMVFQMESDRTLVTRLAHQQPVSYPYELRYSDEDVRRLSVPPKITGAISVPWRVVLVGEDLNRMVNNDVIFHLNPAPDTALFPEGIRTSWIKPGRAVWKYLDGGGESSLETMKKFTDQAASLGFEHNILEGFWRDWREEDIIELVNYSNEKGVGIWLWQHSNVLRNSEDRLQFFTDCRDWGVTGVKLDFFDHEAKEVIDLYQNILEETAAMKLLVNFHGANKPTGEARTWPNELTREAIRGMEAGKLEDRATHNTTVPFTRFLAGHAEYTPVHFGDRRKNTTWTHQIASAAIMHTPLLTYAANPARLLDNPAVEIIRQIPSTWDETIVLDPSEIGEIASYARRKNEVWFLAIMNGVQSRSIAIPLDFLPSGEFVAIMAKDDPMNAASLIMEERLLDRNRSLTIDLGKGGGFIAMFVKSQ